MQKKVLNNKKMRLIPPFFHANEYVTVIKKKAELFNSFFAKQCSLISNSNELPLNLHYTTSNDIEKITQKNLDPKNAHGHERSVFA